MTVEMELYEQVQDLKKLLMEWQRTSTLNKTEKLDLRRRTREALLRSSTAILTRHK